MSTQTETLNSFLSFRLGDELFAANVSKVLEILEIPKITKVPRSPAYMRGVINLRGTVLPVIDTRVKFGFPPVDDTVNSCILVLNVISEEKNIVLGAVVDAVQEVMEIDSETVQAVPSMGTKYKTEFISGMLKIGEAFVMLVNVDLVFTTSEVSILENASHTENENA